MAQGEFLAFIDLENVWLPDKLTLQMALFEDYPQLDGVFGYIHGYTNARLEEELELKFQCINIPGYLPGAMLIRRKSWKKVGEFTDRFATWYRQAVKSDLLLMMLPVIVARRRSALRLWRQDD